MKAPAFSLPDQNGKIHRLSDYKGAWVVVYFYPKDDTPGCTTEACGFRDMAEAFSKRDIIVLGISNDGVDSHKKFADKYHLTFPILSDPKHTVIEAYGAWGTKKFLGREFTGTMRNTYIVNPDGDVVKSYTGVNPFVHPKEVLGDIERAGKA